MKSASERSERGAVAVEFALVMPLVILLVLGAIDFGLLLQARAQAANAAREGVRAAALGRTKADSEAIALNALTGVLGDVKAHAECVAVVGLPRTCTLGGASSGDDAKVSVTIRYQGVTGLFPMLADAEIVSVSTMRIE
ncbi:MAG: pilus assembly protein [Propionibacteriaceae bacterium]|nr:pilus assembly protein [Propionibacteriaceae bacterium]